LQQTGFFEGKIAGAVGDDVVDQRHTQKRPHLFKAAGYSAVGVAGVRISAGVIVRDEVTPNVLFGVGDAG
jgi:hypothetical protein